MDVLLSPQKALHASIMLRRGLPVEQGASSEAGADNNCDFILQCLPTVPEPKSVSCSLLGDQGKPIEWSLPDSRTQTLIMVGLTS